MMALYYPPLKGQKGYKASDWPENIIPSELWEAIEYASFNMLGEPLYDSNSGWLIIDDQGNPPGPDNVNLQPFAQRVGFKSGNRKPITITIDKAAGTYAPKPNEIFSKTWFDKNKNWVIPVGLGLMLILITPNN